MRAICRKPSFTVMVVFTLALGIGATTAVFSVIKAVLLSPPSYPQPDRIVAAFVRSKQGGRGAILPSEFKGWQTANRRFEAMAGYSADAYNLVWRGQSVRVQALSVTPDFFRVLGVFPFLGQVLSPGDQSAQDKNVVLSHHLWLKHFNADRSIIGKLIKLNDQAYIVSGVMPENFTFIEPVDIYTPARLDPVISASGVLTITQLKVLARLKEGFTLEQAKAESDTIIRQVTEGARKESNIELVTLQGLIVENIRNALMLLFGAVGLLLLIACANAANLILANNLTRYKEIAVRIALGASIWRVTSYFLSECLLLSILGGGGGALIAFWCVRVTPWLLPPEIVLFRAIKIDFVALLFILSISFVTGLVLALIATIRFTTKLELSEFLNENPRRSLTGPAFFSFRNLLVISQVALTLVLLISAGILAGNVIRLLRVDLGFNPTSLITFSVSLTDSYASEERIFSFYQQSLQGIAALPGVTGACVVNPLPLGGVVTQGPYQREGEPSSSTMTFVAQTMVSNDYFRVMQIRAIRGRYFTSSGSSEITREAIIDENFARRFFVNDDPIGRRVSVEQDRQGQPRWLTIVGIVRNVKKEGIEIQPEPTIYVPFDQTTSPTKLQNMSFVVRSAMSPSTLAATAKQVISNIDHNIPIFSVKTMDRLVAESVASQQVSAFLVGAFAIIATTLSCIGIYGLVSHMVMQRIREIGIRLALGASGGNIIRLVFGQGIGITLTGMVTGIVIALLVTRFMTHLLVGVSANQLAAFMAASSFLLLVAVPACYLPARRATKVDPIISLRS